MQENTEIQVIRPSKFLWYTSLILFILSIAGVVGLYAAGMYTDGSIGKTEDEITRLDHDIGVASADKKVVIAQIIKSNTIRPSLDLKNIVAQFRIAAMKAGVNLQGFSIQNDTISTTLIATLADTRVHPDPVSTIIRMMRDYATAQGLYFTLGPITTISGDLTKRTTGIELKIVPAPLVSTSSTDSNNQ